MSCSQKYSFYGILILLIATNVIHSLPETPCNDENMGEYVAHPDSCTSYYGCFMNEWYSFTCPPGLEFNPGKKVCDRPITGGCAFWTSTTLAPTTTTPIPTTTTPVPTTTTPVPTTTPAPTTTPPTTSTQGMSSTTTEGSGNVI